MWRAFVELDRILRGEVTDPKKLEQGNVQIPLVGIFGAIGLLAVGYGFCMGTFALIRGIEREAVDAGILQTLASMTKVPLLYLLTLVVTFPSLYVFNAIVGSQIRALAMLKLLVASVGVNIAVLASLGPIVIFFSMSTPNYQFVVLLNVVVFGAAGFLGLGFLAQTLNRLSAERGPSGVAAMSSVATGNSSIEVSVPAGAVSKPGPLKRTEGKFLTERVRQVFWIWMFIFGMVGSQMGWVLRPFIGNPDQPFSWFRERDSNFFQAVWNIIT